MPICLVAGAAAAAVADGVGGNGCLPLAQLTARMAEALLGHQSKQAFDSLAE